MPRSESDPKAFDAFSPWSRQRARQTDEPTGRYFSDEEVLRMGFDRLERAWRGNYRGAYFVYERALRRELDRRLSRLSTADHAALQILERTLDDVNEAARRFTAGGGTGWIFMHRRIDIDRLERLVALAPYWPAERFQPAAGRVPGPALRRIHAILRKHRATPTATLRKGEREIALREELTDALTDLERMRMTLPRRSLAVVDAHLVKVAEAVEGYAGA